MKASAPLPPLTWRVEDGDDACGERRKHKEANGADPVWDRAGEEDVGAQLALRGGLPGAVGKRVVLKGETGASRGGSGRLKEMLEWADLGLVGLAGVKQRVEEG
jgi:hypothetical protein